MLVARDGTSLIAAGLDYWFSSDSNVLDSRSLDLSEFQIEEWRLQDLLNVDHFRLPPDYRKKQQNDDSPNLYITMPFFRFPCWHFCPVCKYLDDKRTVYERGRLKCRFCQKKHSKTRFLAQVPFLAVCDRGHIQDFPWREWVHRSASPSCQDDMRLVATGQASLAGQSVKCDCGAERHLGPITQASSDGTTFLSKSLSGSEEDLYLCPGRMPWLGPDVEQQCRSHIRGALRNASNVYYANLDTAIYLPRGTEQAPQALIEVFESPAMSVLIKVAGTSITPGLLRLQHREVLQSYSDTEILAALKIVTNDSRPEPLEIPIAEDARTQFRRSEHRILRKERDDPKLKIRETVLTDYDVPVIMHFQEITLVDKLRETRVLTGFSRINSGTSSNPGELLWLNRPDKVDWLPAFVVFGEGIYLELNEDRLREWEKRRDVAARINPLVKRWSAVQTQRGWSERAITPRSVLLHTFSHLLINRLTFECGYSSASLRERLYISDNKDHPMAGLLIYTAAGDSEGTLGGLVRMGKPGRLESVIRRALEGAAWCSADPICMEMGEWGGQGPDSCNLAACHSCALVPETACEEFNRFLDRGLVVGTAKNRSLGLFNAEGSLG